jgi:putative heme utilization carrier protein HutX
MLEGTQSPIAQRLAAEPGLIIEYAAKEYGVTLREAVEALPAEMRRFAPGDTFEEVMVDIARWGDVTLIIHSEDGVMEIGGPIPEGKVSQDYYNLPGSTGFHGHLRYKRCASIAFVKRPTMGRTSAAVLFINVDGGIMFKVFVGRDENRDLKQDQLKAFRNLAERTTQ